MNIQLRLLRALGFAISFPKTKGPVQSITFYRNRPIHQTMTSSLPEDKLAEHRALAIDAAAKKTIKKRYFLVLAANCAWKPASITAVKVS